MPYGAQGWGIGGDDAEGPRIENLSPAPGVLPGVNQPIEFDIVDDTPDLDAVYIWIDFDDLPHVELVYDSDVFVKPYTSACTITPNATGFHVVIFRSGGWPSAFYITVKGHDASGNKV